jgi:flagellar biosynthesis/type III secretory pathway protein FliH
MRKVEDGDYKIEEIIKEILKNAPAHQDLIIRLNPKDLEDCQKIQQQGGVDELSGVRLVADAGIGRAECVLESPKGIIKSLIDENLEQIAKALNKKTE